ncbi:MAG: hypothetical protein AMJ53_00245 [Gammaproteobacteria bacterium SG8_11]|nr:MAG: hypothetical protein AMJ53_00245 [Gammaproteobacteria bacterium SG8_11]
MVAHRSAIFDLNRIRSHVNQLTIRSPWLWISTAALTIRVPLLFLPNPGRDEAAYFYWSHHFEPAYSFLMQLVVRLFGWLPVSDLFAMRLPALLLGILVIFLLDILLQLRGVNYSFRCMALLLFAFSPWQSNFGVFLNPDNFLVAVLLFFLLAVIREQLLPAALFSGIAVLAKPTGILLIPAGWFIIFAAKNLIIRRKFLYGLIPVIFLLPVILSIRKEMIFAMLEFGKLNSLLPMWEILAFQLALVVVGGGPILLFFAAVGLKQRLRTKNLPHHLKLENMAVLVIAACTFIIFGAAIVLNSQVKYNWILPALVILWPTQPIPIKKYILIPAIVLSMGLGIFQNVMKLNPRWVSQIEDSLPALRSIFALKGGAREANVSASRSWTEHALEFQSMDGFVGQIEMIWEQFGSGKPLQWIISDDYGLAAQLVFGLGNENVGMILPKDGIFARTLSEDAVELSGGIIILAVHRDARSVWEQIDVSRIQRIPHPVTGQLLSVGIPNRAMSSN